MQLRRCVTPGAPCISPHVVTDEHAIDPCLRVWHAFSSLKSLQTPAFAFSQTYPRPGSVKSTSVVYVSAERPFAFRKQLSFSISVEVGVCVVEAATFRISKLLQI